METQKEQALTSLIAGSLTGLVGSLNLEKKAERANTCSDFLDGIMLDFAGRWGDTRCPETKQELSDYLSAKDALIESLKSMKCYGLARNKLKNTRQVNVITLICYTKTI
ncbi:hypothetical protein [Flavobacterium ginsengisoli]|uniref:hypothetical protein n=1 Tax=Flavobacterium ginsengisoli TaxID=871694 RepID=UPI002414D6C6|nr:hypothetical protein [Flavobacterium ginsengisoli]